MNTRALTYWLESLPISGSRERPREGGIAVVGSGLAGVSTAYWLTKAGFKDVVIVDHEPQAAATFRNCGHILNGTVESMAAMVSLHGREVAREIWGFSVEICDDVRHTIEELKLDCEYRRDGYLVIAIDATEEREIHTSLNLLNEMGFGSTFVSSAALEKLGFRNVHGARFEATSAQAHPTKFRNGVLNAALKAGASYFTDVPVIAIEEGGDGVVVVSKNHGRLHYDAAVIATNAYSPLVADFYARHKLVEPFRGQIITSAPLKEHIPVSYPHSFDHGYEYALRTQDNRLMIGGWRHHTPGGEMGTYDLEPNPYVEEGLKEFVNTHYSFKESIQWEYSWAGIMAASKTGFPFIGPTDSPRIFTVAGFTGHGFSWAHGSAKLLSRIILGEKVPAVARFFNPRVGYTSP